MYTFHEYFLIFGRVELRHYYRATKPLGCLHCANLRFYHLYFGRERERERERQTDRQTDRQTGRQAGRQADRQTDRHTDRHQSKLMKLVTLIFLCINIQLIYIVSPYRYISILATQFQSRVWSCQNCHYLDGCQN